MFKKLAGVKAFANSEFFQPGTYVVKIMDTKVNEGFRGTSIVVEAKVLGCESDHEKAPDVGKIAAHVWNCSGDKKTIGLATWKAFVCAAASIADEDSLSDDDWAKISEAASEQNCFRGKIMSLQVWQIITKKGEPFTVHRWIGLATPEELKKFGIA
jgi:hypothetical protein